MKGKRGPIALTDLERAGGGCLHPIDQGGAGANDNVVFVHHVAVRHEFVAWPKHSGGAEGGSFRNEECDVL